MIYFGFEFNLIKLTLNIKDCQIRCILQLPLIKNQNLLIYIFPQARRACWLLWRQPRGHVVVRASGGSFCKRAAFYLRYFLNLFFGASSHPLCENAKWMGGRALRDSAFAAVLRTSPFGRFSTIS